MLSASRIALALAPRRVCARLAVAPLTRAASGAGSGGGGGLNAADSHADFAPQRKAAAAPAAAAAAGASAGASAGAGAGAGDLHAEVSALIRAHRVVLFMKGVPQAPQCGFSQRVVALLRSHGACGHVRGVRCCCANIVFNARSRALALAPTVPPSRARVRLSPAGADIHGVDILSPANAPLRTFLKEFSQWPTFPQLYIDGEFVGGCDIATQMNTSGELAKLLAAAPAKPAA